MVCGILVIASLFHVQVIFVNNSFTLLMILLVISVPTKLMAHWEMLITGPIWEGILNSLTYLHASRAKGTSLRHQRPLVHYTLYLYLISVEKVLQSISSDLCQLMVDSIALRLLLITLVPTFVLCHAKLTCQLKEWRSWFFDHWYCENGLPLEIVSNRDKLFISKFWRALHKLTGVCLAMSSSFHPETDGASERSNKTVNQSICYHVDWAQKGWVAAYLISASTWIQSMHQLASLVLNLHLDRSPQVIPPLVPPSFTPGVPVEDIHAAQIIEKLVVDTQSAADNLIWARVNQAHQANRHQSPDFCPIEGDRLLLNTFHQWHDYAQGQSGRVTKFMPRYDGPYLITHANPDLSSYTLDIPNLPTWFNMFHVSELRRFIPNDKDLFPSRDHPRPGPIVTKMGLKSMSLIVSWMNGAVVAATNI